MKKFSESRWVRWPLVGLNGALFIFNAWEAADALYHREFFVVIISPNNETTNDTSEKFKNS
ncbi:hypothetical protein [Enterobacter bugandensis]